MRDVRPWFWFFLNLPFGATSGFVAVTLGFVLKSEGMSDQVIASLVALNLLPHTWKFFWAPIADSTLTRKRWYVLSNVASSATILGIAFVPITRANLGVLETLIFVNSLAITLLGMAVEGLMAHATAPEHRGRAAGWFQAGNVGGAGIGGGIALYIAEHISTQAAFITLAAILFACTAALRHVPEARPEPVAAVAGAPASLGARLQRVQHLLGAVFRELWQMIASRRGVVALILCFLPIGSAAAQGLFSGDLARQWGASADLVATTTGLLGGVVSAAGCLAGGVFSDRAGRRLAYALSGVILAGIAAGWAIAPQSPATYAVFTLLYQFGSGIAFGCFTGFVLEVIGIGAAATKYNALASLSNIPILYMTKVDGWASTAHGPSTMLLVDGASELIGIAALGLVLAIVRPGRAPAAA